MTTEQTPVTTQREGHTEGPWAVNIQGWKPWEDAVEIRGGGETIAWTPSGIGNELSNARLIAAAPDLLEALKLAYDALSRPDIYTAHPVGFERTVAHDAISKATGAAS